jgi:hypothetical protein
MPTNMQLVREHLPKLLEDCDLVPGTDEYQEWYDKCMFHEVKTA